MATIATTPDPFDRIIVLAGEDLRRVAAMIADLDPAQDTARLVIDDGVKLDVGAGWSLPIGRMAGPTGR